MIRTRRTQRNSNSTFNNTSSMAKETLKIPIRNPGCPACLLCPSVVPPTWILPISTGLVTSVGTVSKCPLLSCSPAQGFSERQVKTTCHMQRNRPLRRTHRQASFEKKSKCWFGGIIDVFMALMEGSLQASLSHLVHGEWWHWAPRSTPMDCGCSKRLFGVVFALSESSATATRDRPLAPSLQGGSLPPSAKDGQIPPRL